MKKLFGHTKRPYEEWDDYEEEDICDWDDPEIDAYATEDEESAAYYSEDVEEGGFYAEDAEEVDACDAEGSDAYYSEEIEDICEEYPEEEGSDAYYSEEIEDICEEYPEEEGSDAYYGEEIEDICEEYPEEEGSDVYYSEEIEDICEEYPEEEGSDAYYSEEIEDICEEYPEEEGSDVYYTEDLEPYRSEERKLAGNRTGRKGTQRKNLAVVLWDKFLAMGVMDRVITVTGAAVLILALVTGSVYVSAKFTAPDTSDFVSVGSQLEGISMIGERGLLAVADAELARMAAADAVEEEEQKEYDEEEYSNDVTIKLNLTSVMKDLKIKFTNKETGKLVANVPFSVTVTPPKGKSETWTDDDMDGIIYKKNIEPGIYSVLMNELSGEKYKGYTVPTSAQEVEVKKNIAYDKIDVSDEVKKESEIDVSKEDTQIKDTVVESTLQDTVAWVESTQVTENYTEVSKSTIPDPATLVLNKNIVRLAQTGTGNVSGGDEEANKPFTASVSPATVQVGIGASASAQITAAGYTTGKTLKYTAAIDKADVASVSVDAAGKLTVTGKAAGTASVLVTVDYAEGTSVPVTVSLPVTVLASPTITLDKNTASVFRSEHVVITATVSNATADGAVTAVSSNPGVATAAVSGTAVTVTGVAEGTTVITVKYTANGQETKADCTVTVKAHPKDNKTNKLKDSAGKQLYVQENQTYREAVYADYYTASKFFIKGAVKYTGWQTIDGHVYFFTASGEKVTGEQVIQGAKYTFASDGSLVTGSGTMGIDVSKWNGNIDWNAVKNSGVSYVIIRCGYRGSTQGMLIEDPKFNANIKGATEAGLKVGVYFFTQAVDEVEAVEEASYVLDKIKNYKISYPVFLDVEASGGRADKIDKATRTAVCKAFCETIQRNGYTAGIYANKSWLTGKIDAGALSAYKIWLAQYAAAPTYKGRYDLWQYKSTGRVSGIKGDVDLNLSYLGY